MGVPALVAYALQLRDQCIGVGKSPLSLRLPCDHVANASGWGSPRFPCACLATTWPMQRSGGVPALVVLALRPRGQCIGVGKSPLSLRLLCNHVANASELWSPRSRCVCLVTMRPMRRSCGAPALVVQRALSSHARRPWGSKQSQPRPGQRKSPARPGRVVMQWMVKHKGSIFLKKLVDFSCLNSANEPPHRLNAAAV